MAKPKVPIDFLKRYGPKTLNNPVRSPQLIYARATAPFYSLTPFGSHMRSECLLRDPLNVGLVALVYYIPVIGGVIVFLGWCYLYWWLYCGVVGGVVVVVKAALRVAILILVRLLYLNVFLVGVLVVIMGVVG